MRLSRVRFTVRRLMVMAAVIALMIAVYLWVVRPPVIPVEFATQPRSANTDHDLFDIVLTDLIDNKDFYPATVGRGVEKRQIVFGNMTEVGLTHVEWLQDKWIGEKNVASEIKDDLLSRNPRYKRFILAHYQPSNPDILVRDLSQIDQGVGFTSQYPKARGYVEANLPGYSRDGRTAVVLFTSGPRAHPDLGYADTGTYLLRKLKGRWEIVERSIWRLE